MEFKIRDKPHVFLFILILVLSTGFRLVYLDQPMKYDEAYTFNQFASRTLFYVVSDYHAPNNQIFHTIFVHLSYSLFGKDEIFVRLPSFLFGILSVLGIYFLARKLFDKNVALLSMVLLSVSQFFIGYSAEARGYTLTVFLAIMTVYFVNEALRTEKFKFWIISTVLASLSMYTIPSMLYLVFGIFVWALFIKINRLGKNQKLKKPFLFLLLSIIITILLYVPALIYTGTGWILFVMGGVYGASVGLGRFISGFPPMTANVLETFSLGLTHYAVLLIFVLLGYYFLYREKSFDRLILFLSLPITTLLIIIIQSTLPPARIFIFLLPLFYMLISKGILDAADLVVSSRKAFSKHHLERIIPLLIILAFLVQGIYANFLIEKDFSHDNEEVAKWLKANLEPGDNILVHCCEDQQILFYMGKESYYKYENLESNVSRILIVINPEHKKPVEEFVKMGFETRGATEYEMVERIGRISIYRSTKLENFVYIPGLKWISARR